MKILVVDDDEAIGRFLKNILASMGHLVILSDNGYEALTILNKEKVDLVITDLKMPEMDGLTLLKTIMQDDELRDIAVVLMTGYNDGSSTIKASELGIYGYLNKPIKLNDLIVLLDEINKKISGN